MQEIWERWTPAQQTSHQFLKSPLAFPKWSCRGRLAVDTSNGLRTQVCCGEGNVLLPLQRCNGHEEKGQVPVRRKMPQRVRATSLIWQVRLRLTRFFEDAQVEPTDPLRLVPEALLKTLSSS